MKPTVRLFAAVLLLTLPSVVQAQFDYTTNNGTIIITGYTGPGGAVAIPDTINGLPVTRIGDYAFYFRTSVTSVKIPKSVSSIGDESFAIGSRLTGAYFQGNAPSDGRGTFTNTQNAIVYYLPGTTGWGTKYAGRPTVLWNPLVATGDASFGVLTNRFGFNITWASDRVLVVEACTNLTNPAWTPVGTNTLIGGSSFFSDPQWTNQPARFYRLRSP